jgi:hypothetical protein
MSPRRCLVTIADSDGVCHSVEVTAGSVFEAAAEAVKLFRLEGWAAEALTPAARLRVEVRLPPVVHDVPLRALERWTQSPTISPKDHLVKRSGRPAE